MTTPRPGGTRGARIAARADILLETARQYAHGCASAADLLTAATEYTRAVDDPPVAKTKAEAEERKGRTGT